MIIVARDVAKQITVEFKVVGLKTMGLRFRLGIFLMKAVQKIMGVNIEVSIVK